MDIRLKRAYDAPHRSDGTRILVDGMWPRGVAKADAELDGWCREVAPSGELRRWFGHEPERWDGFRRAYHVELADSPVAADAARDLAETARRGRLTLVFGAKDRAHNNAVALKQFLETLA